MSVDADVEAVAELAQESSLSVAVAESLTSGAVASALGAGPEASEWFRGGVVAYAPTVKFDVLGVTPGRVVTEQCAREMAVGVASLLGADVAAAVTGVGGPGPDEGEPAGTTIIAVTSPSGLTCRTFRFDGDPSEVLEATVEQVVSMTATAMRESVAAAVGGDVGR